MCWVGGDNCQKKAYTNVRIFKAIYVKSEKNAKKYYAPLTGYEYIPNKLYEVDPLKVEINGFGESVIGVGIHGFSMNCDVNLVKSGWSMLSGYDCYKVCGFSFYDGIEDLYPFTTIPGVGDVIRGKFNIKFLECIIPKGTIYYENELGEIVSNKLIITDKELCVGTDIGKTNI